MKIINNGIEKDIEILKHFKLDTDEYILYQDNDLIGIGYINENKITIPNSEKMDSVKKIIANFISSNPSDLINSQYKCVVLSNTINNNLEEISVQHIKLTDVQIANLTHKKDLSNYEYKPMYSNYKEKRETSIVSIIIVLVLLGILAFIGLQLKDKIAGNSNNNPKSSEKAKKTTKETVIKDPNKALDNAYKTIATGNIDDFIKLIPKPLQNYYKKELTSETIDQARKNLIGDIGTDIKIDTTNLSTNKMDEEWLLENNRFLQESVGPKVEMTECYEYHGSVTLKGSKGEKTITETELNETWYCKVNGSWGFIFG